MRWRQAARPEIAGRGNQPRATMMLPDAIDDYAGRERILRVDDGLSQFQPAASLCERLALRSGDRFQELTRHLLAGTAWVAADQHGRILWLAVSHDHRARWSPR